MTTDMNKISGFKNQNVTTPNGELSLSEIADWIKSDERLVSARLQYQQRINQTTDPNLKKEIIDKLKGQLPAVTFSGSFSRRNASGIESHSELIVIDIDNIFEPIELETLKNTLCKESSVALCFISPSGEGLKIIHKISLDLKKDITQQHKQRFEELLEWYLDKYQIKIDASGSDVSRLCFLIHDPNVYFNANAKPFSHLELTSKTSIEVTLTQNENISLTPDKQEDKTYATETLILDEIIKFLSREEQSLTKKYEDWINVCFALVNSLPQELGLKYFHKFSKSSDKYNPSACDKQFSSTSPRSPGYGLGYIINKAKGLGFTSRKLGKKHINLIKRIEFHDQLQKSEVEMRFNQTLNFLEYKVSVSDKWKMLDDRMLDHIYVKVANMIFTKNEIKSILQAESPLYNPIKQFIKELKNATYKNSPITQLANTVTLSKDQDPQIAKIAIETWFVSHIRSLIDQNHVNEYVLILVGAQGAGKTRWVRRLLPPNWRDHYFLTRNLTPGEKDDEKQLGTRMIISMDEISSIINNKHSIEAFKNMISNRTISIRLPYASVESSFTRIASLVGTSNEQEFLRDLTGNRRFLPLLIDDIEPDHKINIMAVYKEALDIYEKNPSTSGYLTQSEDSLFTKQHQLFEVSSSEDHLIDKYFSPVPFDHSKGVHHQQYICTSTDLIQYINIMERGKINIKDSYASYVAKMLKKKGFQSTNKKVKYNDSPNYKWQLVYLTELPNRLVGSETADYALKQLTPIGDFEKAFANKMKVLF